MRANPRADWSMEDVTALCREHGLRCTPPTGGSHYKISHPAQRDILIVPSHWPVKPIYILKLVRFVDAVGARS
jgi:hypothetical protein